MGTQNAINNIQSIDEMRKQALINGNFDRWRRGTTFTNPVTGTYTAERWQINRFDGGGTPPTNIIHSQQTLTPGDIPNSFYYYRINPDGAGSSFGATAEYSIRQFIEWGTRYLAGAGQQVTVSLYARSSLASKKLGIRVFQYYGTGGSPTAPETIAGEVKTLTSSWAQYSTTITLNTLVGKTFGTNNDDALGLDLYVMWGSNASSAVFGGATEATFGGSGTIDIAQVQLCAGNVVLNFSPRPIPVETALCDRYFFKTFAENVAPAQNTGDTTGAIAYYIKLAGINNDGESVRWRQGMRTTPTITYFNPSAANAKWRNTAGTDSGTPASQFLSDSGLFIQNPQVAVTDGIGNLACIHLTADAEY